MITSAYSQQFRDLNSPMSKYLYEYRDIHLSRIRDSLHQSLLAHKVDREKIEMLTENIYKDMLRYTVYKYRLDGILDTLETLKYIQNDLFANDYFKKRLNTWKDSTVIEYIAFSVELNILKKHFGTFLIDEFKKTDIYRRLKKRAQSDSLSPEKIDSVLAGIEKIGFEPLNFYYRPNSIKEQLAADKFDIKKFDFNEMIKFCSDHRDILEKAETEYKVNREIIVAILRKETNLGKYPLKYNPFEVLLGQSLYSIENPAADIEIRKNNLRRISRLKESAFSSLYNILKYTISNSIDPRDIKSNFVGAVGFTQFMPFNLHLARDGDGDGIADLMNMSDAIMSIGNFLNSNGWNQFCDIKSANRKKIMTMVLKYNTNESYAESVYEIAAEIKRLSK